MVYITEKEYRKRIYLYSKIYISKSRSLEITERDNLGFNIYIVL